MQRYQIFSVLILGLMLGASGQVAAAPNILLIIGDDMGVDTLASYGIGENFPKTPALDELAQLVERVARRVVPGIGVRREQATARDIVDKGVAGAGRIRDPGEVAIGVECEGGALPAGGDDGQRRAVRVPFDVRGPAVAVDDASVLPIARNRRRLPRRDGG